LAFFFWCAVALCSILGQQPLFRHELTLNSRSVWAVLAPLTQSVIRLRQQVALPRGTGG